MLLEFEFKVSTVRGTTNEEYEGYVVLPVEYHYTKEDIENFAINKLGFNSLKDFLYEIHKDEEIVEDELKDFENGIEFILPIDFKFRRYLENKYQSKFLRNLDNENCRIGDTLYLSDILKQE